MLLPAVLTVSCRVAFTALFARLEAMRAATHIPLLTYTRFAPTCCVLQMFCRLLLLLPSLLLLLAVLVAVLLQRLQCLQMPD